MDSHRVLDTRPDLSLPLIGDQEDKEHLME